MTVDKPLLPVGRESIDSLEKTIKELISEIKTSSIRKRNNRYKEYLGKEVVIITTAIRLHYESGSSSVSVYGILDKETEDDVYLRDAKHELQKETNNFYVSKDKIIIIREKDNG